MVNCASCSNEADEGDNYCRQCGEPYPEEDALNCDCGADVEPEDNYCHACGAAFSGTEESAGPEQPEQSEQPTVEQPQENSGFGQ